MNIWAGLLAVVAAAMMQGSFGVPQKFVRNWPWEKSWLFYCFAGVLLFPWAVVALTVPHTLDVYAQAGAGVVGLTAVFGACWGIGSVLFGLGLDALGVALGFSIMMSMIAALGSLIPMAVLHPADLFSGKGALLILGLVLAIVGVVLCARAGALKAGAASTAGKRHLARGILICVLSGAASPGMAFAFNFAGPIERAAKSFGASEINAPMASFVVAVTAGFFVNAGYCVYLLRKNQTWGKGLPEDRGRNLLFTFAMGFLWFMGFYLYGVGKSQMGQMGAAIAWPILMVLQVLVANVWGLVTGEWKNADRRAFRYLGAGLAIIIASVVVIARAS